MIVAWEKDTGDVRSKGSRGGYGEGEKEKTEEFIPKLL